MMSPASPGTQDGPQEAAPSALPEATEAQRPSKPWMRLAVFATALVLASSAGIGLGALLAHAPPAAVPLAFYITDAPAGLTALEVTVSSVTAGPDRIPLKVKQGSFDLAALQGPDAAILLAQGDVPADAVGAVEVTFSSARATVDGRTFDVPLVQTLVVEGIRGPATATPTFLLDVDLPSSLVVRPDGKLAFAPVAAAVFSGTTAASGAPTWTPAEAAPAVPLDLSPSNITVPMPMGGLAPDAQPEAAGDAINETPIPHSDAPGWLVVYKDEPSLTHMRAVAEDFGAVFVSSLQSMPVAYVVATREQADMIGQHPDVERVEAEVPIVYDDAESRLALRMPELADPLTGLLDGQGRPIDGRGVGVAVVDSGLDGLHPAFQRSGLVGDSVVADNRKVVSQAFIPLENTDTTSGHGTHVAAVVAGQGGIDPELRGIAPGSDLYGLGIGEASTTVWAAQAFDWILRNHDTVDPPIRVVTNSWSAGTTYNPDSVTTRLVDRMVAQGIVVVFSAGNLGGDGSSVRTSAQCQIPTPGVICVAAYDDQGTGTRDGTIAPYSSRGSASDPSTWPDVSAPGTSVLSARPLAGTQTGVGLSGYVELSGTSQAAPHVAGLAALMLQADGTLLPAEVEAEMKSSAYAFTDGGAYADGHHAKGHGLVDAYAAVWNVR